MNPAKRKKLAKLAMLSPKVSEVTVPEVEIKVEEKVEEAVESVEVTVEEVKPAKNKKTKKVVDTDSV